MKKRRGFFPKNNIGSHIGIILSFVIFIVFLAFLYSTMEPLIKINEDKKFMVEYLDEALMEKLSTTLVTLTITIDGNINQECVVLNDLIDVEKGLSSKIIVKDYERKIISSNILDESDNDLIVNRSVETFLKIYSSEEFDSLSTDIKGECKSLTTEYHVNLSKTNTYLSKTNITDLINDYSEDYESLKVEMNVPEASDFGVGFIDNEGGLTETEHVNVSRTVYVEDFPIRYLDSQANILSGYLRIKIW